MADIEEILSPDLRLERRREEAKALRLAAAPRFKPGQRVKAGVNGKPGVLIGISPDGFASIRWEDGSSLCGVEADRLQFAHTALPWHVGAGNGEGFVFADEGRMRFEDGAGTCLYSVARVDVGWDADEDAANLEFIVRAANAHYELLAACRAVMEWAKTPGEHGGNPYCKEFVKLADLAIAKATGEKPELYHRKKK